MHTNVSVKWPNSILYQPASVCRMREILPTALRDKTWLGSHSKTPWQSPMNDASPSVIVGDFADVDIMSAAFLL